ncbi:MAG TPA: extracellular solute-binding protein [Sumerlaeia bacterium]|nr:extracellular solute-binding protein [Sumerlaeia bacterium]
MSHSPLQERAEHGTPTRNAPGQPGIGGTVRKAAVAAAVAAVALAGAVWLLRAPEQEKAEGKIRLTVYGYDPTQGDNAMNRLCQAIMREDPEILVGRYTALAIAGDQGDTGRLLSWAGQTSPDVVFSFWHGIRKEIEEGFLCSLNEYVGYDGFYGLHPETGAPYELTGKPKLKKDAATGEMAPDINGNVDDDEALWTEWRSYPKINRLVATDRGRLERGPDGKPYEGAIVYGLPVSTSVYYGIVYRRDLFRAAGFNEGEVPKTWDEFWYFCQKLTDPERKVPGAKFQSGQRGFSVPKAAWLWIEWLWSNNSSAIMQAKTNPRTGKEWWFTKEETEFIDPETSESLVMEPSRWKATFATDEAAESLEFYKKLCWQPWIPNPETGEPIDLTKEDIQRGTVTDPRTNKEVTFTEKEVIIGAVRKQVSGEDAELDMFRRGEVAMVMYNTRSLQEHKIPPNNLGFFAIPAAPNGGKQVVGSFRHYHALNSRLAGDKNKKTRDKAWKILSAWCGSRGRRITVEDLVMQGYARFLTPELLSEFGLDEYIEQIPAHWRDQYKQVIQNPRAEPYMGYWYPAEMRLTSGVIGFVLSDKDFEIRPALQEVENKANGRLMFGLSEEEKARYRPFALVGVIIAAVIAAIGGTIIVRSYAEKEPQGTAAARAGSTRSVYARWMPWLLLAPALASIILWAYYPLVRGSIMAFQDYRLLGDSKWAGLDNFITAFTDKDFYSSLRTTFKFAGLALGIGFLTPILLAVLLTEVPKGKVFLRTVFFLPQISSGLVVLFIWKLMYNPTEYGLLNQFLLETPNIPVALVVLIKSVILAATAGIFWVLYRIVFKVEHESVVSRALFALLFGLAVAAVAYPFVRELFALGPVASLQSWATWLWSPPAFEKQDWLGDTKWVMVAVIVPGVWAGAGMGSLIYIAALKNVDEESYEAAEIDGAGFFDKAWYITMPYLKPLILINFVGAFIGVFRDMGNIFAMTGGGPGNATMVMSLHIWYTAFAFLRFGEATSMAWFMGVMLISFTIYQLRILKKVEFRRAEAN